MRVVIDPKLTGKGLFDYLIENKSQLISKKKSLPIISDPLKASYEIKAIKTAVPKADGVIDEVVDLTKIRVLSVANTAYYCDSQMDVLLPDAAKRSINNNIELIYHLRDHEHKTEAILGDVKAITLPMIAWKDLNVEFEGETQIIMFDTIIRQDYNSKLFTLYKNKTIKQHSIGLQYVKIELAINDPDYKEEYALYQKHIDKIANREFVETRGYYWVVSEFKLLENSAVLWGANPITGTIEPIEDENDDEQKDSEHGTDDNHPPIDFTSKTFINSIQLTKFININ